MHSQIKINFPFKLYIQLKFDSWGEGFELQTLNE